MKNIHVLPTNKPSRLIIYSTLLNEFRLLDEPIDDWKHKRNIYITDDSEIKEGDWILKCKNVNDWNFKSGELQEKDYSYFKVKCISLVLLNPEDKKIILTTDQELIEEGVQAIDDTFLQWFVNNPSCEEVEVKKVQHLTNKPYRIIIPQEQPKQEYQSECICENSCRGFVNVKCKQLNKQETLEEAAEKYLQEWKLLNNIHLSNIIHAERCKNDFIAGANYQAGRMYSEEERQRDLKISFIAGHNSKATQAKVLYFAIDRFKSLTERQGGYSFKDVTAVLENLEQELKELEDGN